MSLFRNFPVQCTLIQIRLRHGAEKICRGGGLLTLPQARCHVEGHFQRLLRIEAGVAMRVVPVLQVNPCTGAHPLCWLVLAVRLQPALSFFRDLNPSEISLCTRTLSCLVCLWFHIL